MSVNNKEGIYKITTNDHSAKELLEIYQNKDNVETVSYNYIGRTTGDYFGISKLFLKENQNVRNIDIVMEYYFQLQMQKKIYFLNHHLILKKWVIKERGN
ncbi:hypothetical protein [Natronospora cellulosivora (SeqCode)]